MYSGKSASFTYLNLPCKLNLITDVQVDGEIKQVFHPVIIPERSISGFRYYSTNKTATVYMLWLMCGRKTFPGSFKSEVNQAHRHHSAYVYEPVKRT
jgi:hypothetical protein